MLNIARIGDITAGVCCCHKGCKGTVGFIITGADTISCDSFNVSRIGDLVVGSCGHLGIIITGADTNTGEESNIARVSDLVVGCLEHMIITGCDTTSDEDI